MRRLVVILTVLLCAAAPAGVPVSALETPPDVASLDARIERAQAHVNRWYERIERWYERIDRASALVARLGSTVERTAPAASDRVVRPAMSRAELPAFRLAEARRALRSTLTDPWARHVLAELDTWSAYLAELAHARERALRPVPAAEGEPRGGGVGLQPGQPVTYEGWAGAFLGHLDAPVCGENLVIAVTWATAESTTAAFNPLATTRDMPGAIDMNTVGVKHYTSLRQGLDASRDTLLLGAESYGYGAIVGSLRECASAEVTARAINASAWCRGCVGGAYITGLLPIVRAAYAEHAARLVSTGS